MDDFGYIGSREFHPVFETSLDLTVVVGLLTRFLAEERCHFFLGSHDNPRLPPTLGSEAFGYGLQIGAQLLAFGDVLAHFIDKEVEPEARGLTINVFFDLVCEVLNRQAVLHAVLVYDSVDGIGFLAFNLAIGSIDVVRLEDGHFSAAFPCLAGDVAIRLLEVIQAAALIKISLKLGDMSVLAVVAAHLIEHLRKHTEECIDLCLANDVGFLIDVEQDALRGNCRRLLQVCAQELVVSAL